MNVGELKQRLIGVDDNIEVISIMENAVEAFWREIDMNRLNKMGWKGAIAMLVDPAPKDYRDDRILHSWVSFAGVVKSPNRVTTVGKEPIMEFRISNRGDCPSLEKEERVGVARHVEAPAQLLLPAARGIVKR